MNFALATFIDIASAFDRLDPDAAIKAMVDKNISPHIIKWYGSYLKNRVSDVSLKGINKMSKLSMGCPQGGVLSVLIWILAFDGLLHQFKDGDSVKCVGYADDGCLIIEGTNLEYMYAAMNAALRKAERWASS